MIAVFEELLQGNKEYCQSFNLGSLDAKAKKGLGLVTCIDTRIEPLAMLGIAPGDAKILRNAGGRVTQDVERSLVLATTFLGVKYIVVMHHIQCALANNSDEKVRSDLDESQLAATKDWEFLTMPDPMEALRQDVARLRAFDGLRGSIDIEGWLYDVRSGQINRVIPFDQDAN